jgi:hypothetical protein
MFVLGAALIGGAAAAAEQDTQEQDTQAAQTPACKTAEVNPVTGHVFCIDPLGADVEPPPASAKPKCEEASRGQWTWAPNCDDVVPEG